MPHLEPSASLREPSLFLLQAEHLNQHACGKIAPPQAQLETIRASMTRAYRLLKPNHYLSTHIRLVKEWNTQDVVTFSQLVDFTGVERVRDSRKSQNLSKPSYTAFVIDAIAQALRNHPKVNRIVYRSLAGYRWAQFERVDIAVAVEVVEDGLDVAYARIIRDADHLGLGGIADELLQISKSPGDQGEVKRLRMLPAPLIAFLARCTKLHPKLWVPFRGGCCSVTSPSKYGVENVAVKSSWPLQFAFGRVQDRPMVVSGACVPRRSAFVSMGWHRELTTGAVAARFFHDVVRQLEQRMEEPSGF
jgi:pyruvate/2-oxoglutarate dehydrogenase complex dihydrolipoamide acyltransferase (E2) component